MKDMQLSAVRDTERAVKAARVPYSEIATFGHGFGWLQLLLS